jgi:hypothetical protein
MIQQNSVLSRTKINHKTVVVRASCPHQLYLTQTKLTVNPTKTTVFGNDTAKLSIIKDKD